MTLSRAVTTAPGGPPVRRSRWKRRWITLATSGLLLAGLYVFRAPLLRGLANVWIVSDTITPSDAAVVLGGGLNVRPFAAAGLYTNHLVKTILVMKVGSSPTDRLGLTRPESDTSRDILLQLGVPAENIQMVGENVGSTYDEAIAVREWVQKNKSKTLVIPTDMFHTRRVCWLFNKLLADTDARVLVTPLESTAYSSSTWWRKEVGLMGFESEVLKYVAYRWKY